MPGHTAIQDYLDFLDKHRRAEADEIEQIHRTLKEQARKIEELGRKLDRLYRDALRNTIRMK